MKEIAKLTSQKGQSLFEVLFALAIAGGILVAIVSLTTTGVSNSTGSKNRSTSSTLTQEAVEWLRQQRDSNYDVFASFATGATYCLNSLGSTLPSPASCLSGETIDGIFTREARLTSVSPDEVQADVIVSWSDATGAHESRSITSFTDWRAR